MRAERTPLCAGARRLGLLSVRGLPRACASSTWTHVEPIGDFAVLQVTGEVDVDAAPMLREQMRELATKGAVHLIADLGQVDFLDSTGLGALVGGLKRLPRSRRIAPSGDGADQDRGLH
jgi:ABC-type transporter Mla MlaB component